VRGNTIQNPALYGIYFGASGAAGTMTLRVADNYISGSGSQAIDGEAWDSGGVLNVTLEDNTVASTGGLWSIRLNSWDPINTTIRADIRGNSVDKEIVLRREPGCQFYCVDPGQAGANPIIPANISAINNGATVTISMEPIVDTDSIPTP